MVLDMSERRGATSGMDLDDIRQLYDYNRWANQRTLGAAARLDKGTFVRPMGNSFSSVRDTLSHILSAEWIWLERWNGISPTALLDPAIFPTADSLKARWQTVEQDCSRFIQSLTPARLKENLAYLNRAGQRYEYPLWQQMVHVVNHSSYHRGQVTTLLRQLGAQPVATDFLEYYDERNA
ncbi:MAG TPA: DinB family protein [Candidatus Angelobacter sp.]|nr:DinB family protein [Candidatus Angelobacter sp.]